MNLCENQVKFSLEKSLFVINQYKWLSDSYVLDFFVENHWKNLPHSWQETFTDNFPINELSFLLNYEADSSEKISVVLPLSLLCLRKTIQVLSICRKPQKVEDDVSGAIDHPKFRKLFTKHVKCKKRHEIEIMSQLCAATSKETKTQYIVDVGGGLGHLCRVLAFRHRKRLCCIEKQESLNHQAKILDNQFMQFAQKYLTPEDFKQLQPPVHLNCTISPDMDATYFIKDLKCRIFSLRDDEKFSIGLIGLHPCGDLGPVLLNLFKECPEVTFIAVVGCCYMKLTDQGYPLSEYVRRMQEKAFLSYEAREVACHAMEMYHERLSRGQFDDLKIHAYRSALERIIVRNWPNLRHSGLKSVKYRECTTFREYAVKAIGNLGVKLDDGDLEGNVDCLEWKKVAIFYTLRLMLAPLIESVILNDRLLYIMAADKTATCRTIAAFDPRTSPRNHILLATK